VEKHHGELVVGAAEIVETGDLTKPYLIAAPTMRLPIILGPETVNPYLAIRAVLLLIEHEVFLEGDKRAPK
jgi:O-acetyl-ADP-ribose deacetylase (regulator of RNase III)